MMLRCIVGPGFSLFPEVISNGILITAARTNAGGTCVSERCGAMDFDAAKLRGTEKPKRPKLCTISGRLRIIPSMHTACGI